MMDQALATRFAVEWTQAQPSVFAFICSTVTNFSDAEDVLQKVATVAISKFSEYDQERSFTAWSIGIARFEVLRYLRDRASQKHEYIADALGNIADAFANVGSELDDRRHALANCLNQVGTRPRTILNLRFSEGKKTAEIAAAIGLSPGNVSVILNRSYKFLRNCIDRQLATAGGGQ